MKSCDYVPILAGAKLATCLSVIVPTSLTVGSRAIQMRADNVITPGKTSSWGEKDISASQILSMFEHLYLSHVVSFIT